MRLIFLQWGLARQGLEYFMKKDAIFSWTFKELYEILSDFGDFFDRCGVAIWIVGGL